MTTHGIRDVSESYLYGPHAECLCGYTPAPGVSLALMVEDLIDHLAPTCATCKHWDPNQSPGWADGWSRCIAHDGGPEGGGLMIDGPEVGPVYTAPDFGCTHHTLA